MTQATFKNAQKLAALLPPLLIEAERVAQTVWQGVHGRRRAGIGETFWQFRPYAAGDSVTRIDWRQSARGDRVYVREREWEAAQTVAIWADPSGSMRYASARGLPAKADRARLLALATAALLLQAGEKVIWLGAREALSVQGKTGLERLAAQPDGERDAPGLPPQWPLPRRAHVLLFSDFLMPGEELNALMHGYASRGLRGAFAHILDPLEESFAFDGRVELLGCEGETPMLVPNAAALADAYRRRLAAHKARVQQVAAGAGWRYVRHVTNEPPPAPLMRLYGALSIRGPERY